MGEQYIAWVSGYREPMSGLELGRFRRRWRARALTQLALDVVVLLEDELDVYTGGQTRVEDW